jgi:hypothetical protein
MTHKFPVGQAVEYKPRQGEVSLYTVVRQMPQEHTQFDLSYRIKSEIDGCERSVFECDLKPAAVLAVAEQTPNLYGFVTKLRPIHRRSGHH